MQSTSQNVIWGGEGLRPNLIIKNKFTLPSENISNRMKTRNERNYMKGFNSYTNDPKLSSTFDKRTLNNPKIKEYLGLRGVWGQISEDFGLSQEPYKFTEYRKYNHMIPTDKEYFQYEHLYPK